MSETLVPIVVMTGMFAMIFGIVYLKSRENLALIEKGINPKQPGYRPRPFVNLKWGLLLIGCGLGLLTAYMIDAMLPHHRKIEKKIVINNIDSTSADTNMAKQSKSMTIIKNGKKITIDDDAEGLENFDDDSSKGGSTINNHGIIIHRDAGDSPNNHGIIIHKSGDDNPALYFALIAIGGGLGLFFSYRIEKKEWLDKYKPE